MRQNTEVSLLFRLIRGAALLISVAVFASGCAGQDSPTQTLPAPTSSTASGDNTSEDQATSNEGSGSGTTATAELSIGDDTIIFSPSFCNIQAEDILVEGPGINQESQQVAFLSFDVPAIDGKWHGEARIELGVNDAFSSSDEFYTTFINPQESYDLTITGNEITLTAIFLDANYQTAGEGSLFIRC